MTTTDPAATTELSPIRTPFNTIDAPPTHTFRPMMIGLDRPRVLYRGSSSTTSTE
jgi:hypothetical protein